MFQIELLSGGVFWVYAVYPQISAFLIWKQEAQNDAKTICKTLHGQARHVA